MRARTCRACGESDAQQTTVVHSIGAHVSMSAFNQRDAEF
jgi:hypothetical protein